MNSVSPPDDDLLQELLLRWEELYERGQDTPATELAKDYPDLIAELSRRIKALKTVSWITKPLPEIAASHSTPVTTGAAGGLLGGRYRLEELVAEGGFAEVYRAYDTELQRMVAVKRPKPTRLQATEAFLAEARRVARLMHDGIVPVHDVGVEGDVCYIVSDFLQGGSLADRLSKGTPTSEDAIRWIIQVAEALEYAHLQGIVHRDIKPANILIDHHGRAKLADFGIAQSSTKTGEFAPSLGTLGYMSPEQLDGKPPDHRSDIYSLALVLYELLTGQLPYSSLDPSVVRREILEGRLRLISSVPSRLATCIRTATSRSPHLRQPSAIQFATELRRSTSATGMMRVVPLLLPVVVVVGLSAVFLLAMAQRQAFTEGRLAEKDSPTERNTLPAKPEPTDRIRLSGLGSETYLQGSVPAGWIQQGVFAEIRTLGTAEFPRVAESAYVMEADLVFRNPRGRVAMFMGEPKCNVEICMGDLWEQDAKQDKIATRLFRGHPFSINWIGEAHFEPNQRMSLLLVVADDDQVLFRNGHEVLRARGEPTDFCLRLAGVNGAQATFHSVSCRALTKDDARKANVGFPLRQLRCDVESARNRVKSQIADDWPREPATERDFVLGDDLAMRWIAPGEFTMGSPKAPNPQEGQGAERVRFTQGYWIGAYEVTQGQWQDVMGDNPSRVTGSPLLPVNHISWSDAGRFCTRLTERERKASRLPKGYEYRLPTEAEWEYASMAGTDTEIVVPLEEIAHRDQKYPHLVEVGTTPSNPWGLHEVLGNVAEWCLDQWREYPKDQKSTTLDRFQEGDPSRAMFVVRGNGLWYNGLPLSVFVRAPRHDIAGGFRGFRVVLGPTKTLRYEKGSND